MESQNIPCFVSSDQANPYVIYEWTFTLGILNIMVCGFLLGKFPEYYGYWHVFKSVLLLGNRVVTYTKSKKQLYLLDFCYMANLYSVVYYCLAEAGVLSANHIGVGFRILFSFGCGPLALSIFLLRNSVVPHSLNKITDLFIHASPALLAWAMRWSKDQLPFDICEGTNGCSPTAHDLIVVPACAYLCWWAVYALWMVTCGVHAHRAGYDVVYRLILRTTPAAGRLLDPLPPRLGALVYLLAHALACLAFVALGLPLWRSCPLHTAFLAALLATAVRGGGAYYVRKVFREELLREASLGGSGDLL